MEGSVDGQARVYLQPIAPPSILGLYAFAGSTLTVAAGLAGWYGNSQTALFFPFAAAFGGVAQFAPGMWSYKARDTVATAMHGVWGSFGIGLRPRRDRCRPRASGLSRWPGSRPWAP